MPPHRFTAAPRSLAWRLGAAIAAQSLAAAATAAQPPAAAAQRPPPPPAPGADIVVQGRTAIELTPLPGGPDFISPMGEPFHSTDKLSGAEHWFAQADRNHDGRLTKDELRRDADRFFLTLDTDHDNQIGPDELSRYEQVVAPEIVVLSTYGDVSKVTTDSDGKVKDPPYPERIGAGRYSYLAMPEPVASADANMDRATSRVEFQQAIDKRFRMLDANGDGVVTRDDLPKLQTVHDRDR